MTTNQHVHRLEILKKHVFDLLPNDTDTMIKSLIEIELDLIYSEGKDEAFKSTIKIFSNDNEDDNDSNCCGGHLIDPSGEGEGFCATCGEHAVANWRDSEWQSSQS